MQSGEERTVAVVSMNRDGYLCQGVTQLHLGDSGMRRIVVFACSGQGGGEDEDLLSLIYVPVIGIASRPTTAVIGDLALPHEAQTEQGFSH